MKRLQKFGETSGLIQWRIHLFVYGLVWMYYQCQNRRQCRVHVHNQLFLLRHSTQPVLRSRSLHWAPIVVVVVVVTPVLLSPDDENENGNESENDGCFDDDVNEEDCAVAVTVDEEHL